MAQRHAEDGDASLRRSKAEQFGFRFPLAISQRLDALVARTNDAEESTHRKELLAAIIYDCGLDGDELAAMLHRYRGAKVRDAILDRELDGTNLVEFAAQKPGPRVSDAE